MSERSTCKSCGAQILWITTVTNGKRMPLDYPGERRFVIGAADMTAAMRETYVSHFATCPQRDEHRKPREA